MAKVKTHKGASKRIKKINSGKFLRRYASQDHFNSKESGGNKRNKRRVQKVKAMSESKLTKLLPY